MCEKPRITPEVQRLLDMDTETVYAKDIAPVVHMSKSVIIHYAKTGQWNLCRYVISGEGENARVKFFRRDFLQKNGFLDPDLPERTVIQAIDDLREEIHDIGLILLTQLSAGQILRLDMLKEKEIARQLLQQPTD